MSTFEPNSVHLTSRHFEFFSGHRKSFDLCFVNADLAFVLHLKDVESLSCICSSSQALMAERGEDNKRS